MVTVKRHADAMAAYSDESITAKAKGIMAYLAAAEGEHMTLERMASDMAEGMGALRRGIKELEQAGYLERKRDNSCGHAVYDWILTF